MGEKKEILHYVHQTKNEKNFQPENMIIFIYCSLPVYSEIKS